MKRRTISCFVSACSVPSQAPTLASNSQVGKSQAHVVIPTAHICSQWLSCTKYQSLAISPVPMHYKTSGSLWSHTFQVLEPHDHPNLNELQRSSSMMSITGAMSRYRLQNVHNGQDDVYNWELQTSVTGNFQCYFQFSPRLLTVRSPHVKVS